MRTTPAPTRPRITGWLVVLALAASAGLGLTTRAEAQAPGSLIVPPNWSAAAAGDAPVTPKAESKPRTPPAVMPKSADESPTVPKPEMLIRLDRNPRSLPPSASWLSMLPADLARTNNFDAPAEVLLVQMLEAPPAAPVSPILQVGCPGCSAGGLLGGGPDATGLFASSGCGNGCGGQCVPGRYHECSPCEATTKFGRFCCGLYECICCPDPCYEPRWKPLADAAFYTDSARPQTQTRFRFDGGLNIQRPDRSEFIWARADGGGRGPRSPGPLAGEVEIRRNVVTMYTEAATGNLGVIVEQPYVSIAPDQNNSAAGFGDMAIGTKTLLFDCELLQIAFRFKTYIPVGNFSKGLGTGHVSLEPALIVGLKLSGDSYYQGEISEWIPIGGDPAYAGAVLHTHSSYNHVLCRLLPDVPLIGTLELNSWTFQDGAFTDPVNGPFQKSSGYTYASFGPGLRLFICDKADFGFAASYALTEKSWAKQLYTTEFRWRY
jgi:Putative MetA-pathway of phenol degradation